jgi:glycosyltransferase involved in cell wall biosynthesis
VAPQDSSQSDPFLKRDRLDHLLAYIEARPALIRLTNALLDTFYGSKEGMKRLLRRGKYRRELDMMAMGPPFAPPPEPVLRRPPIAVDPQAKDYVLWYERYAPRPADLRQMAETLPALAYQPTISIIVPTYNTPEVFLREAIDSVLAQIYENWELCIADDASSDRHVRAVLEEYRQQDPRIKVLYREENGHISRSSNSALTLATGEYIALLDHDDLITPDALYQAVLLLNRHPEADMIYSDEDKVDEENLLSAPYFKPDWSPNTFLSRMYTCHFGFYRRRMIEAIGGFRVGFEGSQDYDLVLRFTEQTQNIFHIPKILYHWRIHHLSAASGAAAKPYAYDAAKRAIAEALQRRGEQATVTDAPGDFLGHYVVRYHIPHTPRISIIIPTKDLARILHRCLTSIFERTTYPDFEVILVDNGSVEPKTERLIAKWEEREPNRFHCHRLDIPFNFSQLNNFGVAKASGDYLVFLNNDTEVIEPDWLESMLEQAQRPSVGAVGGLLLYDDDTIQHAGVILGLGGLAAHGHRHFAADTPGYFGFTIGINDVSAVTAACLMCRHELFEQVGGFDEELAVAYNDVDLCLKFLQAGCHNLYLPHVRLYHHESKSRGYENTEEKRDRLQKEAQRVYLRWRDWIENDPHYNPNLTRGAADYHLRIDPTEPNSPIDGARSVHS